MLKLSNTIKVMVPTKDNDGKAIDYMALVQGVTKLVGGSTMYNAQGLWVSSDEEGKVYKDSNKLVEFNMDDKQAYNALVLTMGEVVEPLLHEGGQLSVWLQVNGTTFILNKVNADELAEVSKALPKEVQGNE